MDGSEKQTRLPGPWSPIEVDTQGSVEVQVGSLTLRLKRVESEVWLLGTYVVEDNAQEELDWIRWSVRPTDTLALAPSLPNRAVVVSPERPFFLPPREEARVFVRIPLFVRVIRTDSNGTDTLLADLPSLILSDTWFGTFTEGDLAYWLTTKARRGVENDLFEPHLAMCPLRLMNRSDDALRVERFAVRVSHLTLFSEDERIWTDEILVGYEGSPEGSDIKYTGRVPAEAPNARRIARPIVEPPRGLRALTFGQARHVAE